MANYLSLGAAQLGPIARSDSRSSAVCRMIDLLHQAKAQGCRLITFPEMALTTFLPRWHIEDEAEVDSFFEREMPGPETQPLFEAAAELEIGFYLGYCELAEEGGRKARYNTAILVGQSGRIVGKYRKVHVLGNRAFDPSLPFQHMEPYYFETGNLGLSRVERVHDPDRHVHLQRPALA